MESRRRHLSALLSCLIVLTAGVWLTREGTVQTEPTVVYVDMVLTGRLFDKNAAEYWSRHPQPKVETL
ncbi:MAG TPA: hypothetical protein VHZ78_16400 [Rhizomicrobium sp.]|jgi:hypothetical protein|nr:hypothetical protein [Rhizomicrobium sp.]